MDQRKLESALDDLLPGPWRYFNQTGSTNDEAARWVDAGAPDLSLVIADEQTAGRGRLERKWYTPPGAALAFSLILKKTGRGLKSLSASPSSYKMLSRLTALGALAVSQALQQEYDLPAQIKWPNDVLLERRKVAGVLTEAYWQGDRLAAAILGIGINVAPGSIPPEEDLTFPATCIEAVLGRPVSRLELLCSILKHLLGWQTRLADSEFLRAWKQDLAFQDEWVYLITEARAGAQQVREGKVLGLDDQGSLILRDRAGETFTLNTGEVRLRPFDRLDFSEA